MSTQLTPETIEGIIEQHCNQSSREAHYNAAQQIFELFAQTVQPAVRKKENEEMPPEHISRAERYSHDLQYLRMEDFSPVQEAAIKKGFARVLHDILGPAKRLECLEDFAEALKKGFYYRPIVLCKQDGDGIWMHYLNDKNHWVRCNIMTENDAINAFGQKEEVK